MGKKELIQELEFKVLDTLQQAIKEIGWLFEEYEELLSNKETKKVLRDKKRRIVKRKDK